MLDRAHAFLGGLVWMALTGMAGTPRAGAQGAEERAAGAGHEARGAGASDRTLSIDLTEFRSDRGRVAVALFASEKGFPDQERALAGKLGKIRDRRARVTFEGLRPGVYAVAVLHDENANSRMDFNFIGIPLEGYGFSNDASAAFGPPSFKAAAFRLKAQRSALPVRIRYFFR